MGYRSYKNLLNKASLRTVTGRGNDPRYRDVCKGVGFRAHRDSHWDNIEDLLGLYRDNGTNGSYYNGSI